MPIRILELEGGGRRRRRKRRIESNATVIDVPLLPIRILEEEEQQQQGEEEKHIAKTTIWKRIIILVSFCKIKASFSPHFLFVFPCFQFIPLYSNWINSNPNQILFDIQHNQSQCSSSTLSFFYFTHTLHATKRRRWQQSSTLTRMMRRMALILMIQ